jgi:hypothetical protein
VEANSTGGQGSRRAVAPHDYDDDDDDDIIWGKQDPNNILFQQDGVQSIFTPKFGTRFYGMATSLS